MEELRFRQIHMDYHTSEQIMGVGEKFDSKEFAETLSKAEVDSVTCFARCHHGMLYYDSKRFPELVHPGLANKNMLQEQIDECHKRGIKVPIYTTVQWDYYSSMNHPEWVCMTPNGGLVDCCGEESAQVYEPGFYRTLCVNTPYRDFLKAQVEDFFEVLTPERIDGVFLDIVNVVDCSCKHCVDKMLRLGYDPKDKTQRVAFSRETMNEFKREMSAFIRSFKNDVTIFYNAGHINAVSVESKDAYSHWELESLPSGAWGYSHFTNTVRYARTTGKDYVTHTGKFHTEWGDFHSFKNPEALQYECFRMLAYNSKCLIGDQLDPDGKISSDVYHLIGQVYAEVKEKEAWCAGAKEVTDLALFTSECLDGQAGTGNAVPVEVNGACTMLDELGYQFNIVDKSSDLSGYRLLILPDMITCDSDLQKRLEDYIAAGGKVIATGKSGLNKEKTEFALGGLGVHYLGEAPYSPDFIMPNERVGKNLPRTEHVMYDRGEQAEPVEGNSVMDVYIPYFNRTWEHFCSHRHTPSSHIKGYTGLVENGGCRYFAHPVFTTYYKKHPKWCKEIVKDMLEELLPARVVAHDGPTTLITTLNEQQKEGRYVLHALHYIPLKSSQELFTIEDIIPLYQIKYSVAVDKPVKSVRTVPEGNVLEFTVKDGRTEFVLPEINGHTMVELNTQKL